MILVAGSYRQHYNQIRRGEAAPTSGPIDGLPVIQEQPGPPGQGQNGQLLWSRLIPTLQSSEPDVHILTIRKSGRYPVIASMNSTNTDVIQGTLDMLILKTLSLEPMHGFGIARRIEQITQNVFKVNAGSLLTALQRLERNGWLAADWLVTENSRRAKVYRLTQTGRKQLQDETADWQRRSAAISRFLKAQA